LNDEANLLNKLIENSVNVQGSDTEDYKQTNMLKFANGEIKCLITKPKIAGFGMNWQNCHNMIFVGLSDSFEAYYQAVRRCWRFGQKYEVNAYIVISQFEGTVVDNIKKKQDENEKMKRELISLTKDIIKRELTATKRITAEYNPTEQMILPVWKEFKKYA
jgi:superfamily II DNA helicase RecQ